MNNKKIQEEIEKVIHEWRSRFTTDDNLGNLSQLDHFLLNDDSYEEPIAGGDSNEVHQYVKFLTQSLTHIATIAEQEGRNAAMSDMLDLIESGQLQKLAQKELQARTTTNDKQ